MQIDSFSCSVFQTFPNSSTGHMFKDIFIWYITWVSEQPVRSHLGKENAFFKRTPNVCLYSRVLWVFFNVATVHHIWKIRLYNIIKIILTLCSPKKGLRLPPEVPGPYFLITTFKENLSATWECRVKREWNPSTFS